MPEQKEKANTEICRRKNSQHDGQQQKFIVQHLLHEGGFQTTRLG